MSNPATTSRFHPWQLGNCPTPCAADSRRLSRPHLLHDLSSSSLPAALAVLPPPLQRSPSCWCPPALPCSADISGEEGGLLDSDPHPPTVICQPDNPDTNPTLVPHVVLAAVPSSRKMEISEGVKRVSSSSSSRKRIAIKEVMEILFREGFIRFRRISSRGYIQMSGQTGRQGIDKVRCSTIQCAFDPGGYSLPKHLLTTVVVVSWFLP